MKRNDSLRRTLSLLLAALLLAPAMLSCSESAQNDGADAADPPSSELTETIPEEAVEVESEEELVFPHEDRDLGGQVFTVVSSEDRGGNGLYYDDLIIEEITGDTMNDAYFNRNLAVADRFNVGFADTSSSDAPGMLQRTVQAGTPDYDMAALRLSEAYEKTTYCVDLKKLDGLSLESPWWDQNCVRDMSVAGSLKLLTGDLFIKHYDGVQTTLFNKDMAKNYQLESLYGAVLEGRWTLDKMAELCEVVTVDLDGNGTMDRYDQWGYASQMVDLMPALFSASDLYVIQKDQNDVPYYDLDLEKISSVLEKAAGFYRDYTFDIQRDAGFANLCAFWVFPEGRSLFYWAAAHYIPWQLRDLEFDYGILPVPKYDEAQENYISALSAYHSYCCMIPKSAGDAEFSAYVMDALAFCGLDSIKPAYYETCLKRKYANDAESATMLDIIFSNIRYDLGIYADFGSFLNALNSEFAVKSEADVASLYQKSQKIITKALEKYLDSLEKEP